MITEGKIINNRYEIISCIGHGGSGDVYLADDKKLRKKWAVKCINVKRGLEKEVAENEIAMMRGLDYPLFPRIVDAFSQDEGYYIVSDYIDGISLSTLISDSGMSENRVIENAIVIASGLMYLHTRQPAILYLDLKPGNIMVKKDGSLRLIDFGIAQNIHERKNTYGTPGYAPPEQYRGRDIVLDERADIFAFGMLMYEMLSGKKISNDYYYQRNIILKDKNISSRLKSVILKCIRYNRDNRYNTVSELLTDLNHIKKKKSGKNNIIKLFTVFIVILIGTLFTLKEITKAKQVEAASQMINAAKEHISDGEYDAEGVRIIASYIDSGCLGDKASSEYAYEIAMNFFLFQQDYYSAKKYFSILDKRKYPECVYFIRICDFQTGFGNDVEYIKCIDELYEVNKKIPFSYRQCVNALFIARCYESEAETSENSINKAAECLVREYVLAQKYLTESDIKSANDQEKIRDIFGELSRRLFLLTYFYSDENTAKSYGEMALKYLTKDKVNEREDICEKLNEIARRRLE